jgi:hypothetical protein
MTMLRRLSLAVLVYAALFAPGCSEDFDPYNRVNSLRVLAIRSDPPLPGPGETATLSALVYTPADSPPPTLRWSWCPMAGPAEQGYPCQVSAEQAAMLEEAGVALPSFDLGSEPTAKLTHSIDPLVLGALCDGSAGVLPALPVCEGGFPVQVRLTAESGDQTVMAVRELRLRFDPATEPNQNPTIAGLMVGKPGAQDPAEFVPLAEGQALPTVPRDEETPLRAVVPESAAETYDGRDNDRQPARVHEQLVLTWFVETGDTRSERTSFIFGEVAREDFLSNEWTPPRSKMYPSDRSRLLVVIRDNRGGVSWTEGAVMLGQDP